MVKGVSYTMRRHRMDSIRCLFLTVGQIPIFVLTLKLAFSQVVISSYILFRLETSSRIRSSERGVALSHKLCQNGKNRCANKSNRHYDQYCPGLLELNKIFLISNDGIDHAAGFA